MKRFLFTSLLLILSLGWVFAEGTSEANTATGLLVNELTRTLVEAKGAVNTYAPAALAGMVAMKQVYYKQIFPKLPILTVAMLVLGVVFIFLTLVNNYDSYTSAFFGVLFLVLFVIGLIWSLVDWMQMAQFNAAPEVFIIQSLLRS